MNFGLIKGGICINAIVLEGEPSEDEKSVLVSGICDDIVVLTDGFGIGDYCIDSVWSKEGCQTPADHREQAYESMIVKTDGTDLIPWEGKAITVDQANKVYLEYSAEGSSKVTKIQTLIVAAKTYIRGLYPDAE